MVAVAPTGSCCSRICSRRWGLGKFLDKGLGIFRAKGSAQEEPAAAHKDARLLSEMLLSHKEALQQKAKKQTSEGELKVAVSLGDSRE